MTIEKNQKYNSEAVFILNFNLWFSSLGRSILVTIPSAAKRFGVIHRCIIWGKSFLVPKY